MTTEIVIVVAPEVSTASTIGSRWIVLNTFEEQQFRLGVRYTPESASSSTCLGGLPSRMSADTNTLVSTTTLTSNAVATFEPL